MTSSVACGAGRGLSALWLPALSIRAAVVGAIVLGVLDLGFDTGEVDRLLAQRRAAMLRQLLLQVLVGAAVLLGVPSMRLLRPIDQLKASPARSRRAARRRRWSGAAATSWASRRCTAVARRGERALALLFIDLDRFKDVNDTLVHGAGDQVLLGTSQRLLQALRQSDLVCRVSGDEFLVLLRDAESDDIVRAAAERALHAIEAPLLQPAGTGAAQREAQVGASIGIALYPRDGEDFDTLVRHADQAMYQAKQQGRARCAFYDARLDDPLLGRVELERELQQAIGRGELLLHFQPVVDAQSGAVCGCEALVRWRHPQRGLLQPAQFIEAAEASGLIRELGAWTLEAACAQLRQWKRDGLQPCRVAVNVSAHQFRDQRLIETLQRACERHDVQPGELELELTESTLMTDTEMAGRIAKALRALGVALVVDDFGTGYSSLAYLKKLKPDELKIDRAFVRDLPDDADDRALVAGILALARALGLDVVAEGVETAAQQRFLADSGCRLLQGSLPGAPVPADAFAARLQRA